MNERRQRLAQALDRRIGHVRCAIEAVYHRHNVSAVLRTCDAMGIQHVHLVERHFSASRGPARGAERWLELHHHESPDDAIAAIRAAGCAIYIADLADTSVTPETVPLDRPVCLWFGAELVGVGPEVKAVADGVVTVPMHGLAQSLNISVAAALTMRAVAERARAELGEKALLSKAEHARIWGEWIAREDAMRGGIAARFADDG